MGDKDWRWMERKEVEISFSVRNHLECKENWDIREISSDVERRITEDSD